MNAEDLVPSHIMCRDPDCACNLTRDGLRSRVAFALHVAEERGYQRAVDDARPICSRAGGCL